MAPKINQSSAIAEISDRLATIDMGRKVGTAVPLFVERAGSPSNIMSPELRATYVSSGILIHPTMLPQYINVTDRQNRQQSHSIGEPIYKRSPKNGSGDTDHGLLGVFVTLRLVLAMTNLCATFEDSSFSCFNGRPLNDPKFTNQFDVGWPVKGSRQCYHFTEHTKFSIHLL